MTDLDSGLAHQLNAVLGWVELGNPREARLELDAISPEHQDRPEVLEIRWILLARLEEWNDALETAERLLEVAPDSAAAWLHRAYSLRRAPGGGVEQAARSLRPACEKFPEDATIPYNLACYSSQLGQLDEARFWLGEAMKRGGKRQIKAMALNDSDLEPLWDEIRSPKRTRKRSSGGSTPKK